MCLLFDYLVVVVYTTHICSLSQLRADRIELEGRKQLLWMRQQLIRKRHYSFISFIRATTVIRNEMDLEVIGHCHIDARWKYTTIWMNVTHGCDFIFFYLKQQQQKNDVCEYVGLANVHQSGPKSLEAKALKSLWHQSLRWKWAFYVA